MEGPVEGKAPVPVYNPANVGSCVEETLDLNKIKQ